MGLLFFAIFGIGVFAYSCYNGIENAKWREQSKKNGDNTYIDNTGKIRLTNNNHPILRSTKKINGKWDDVLVDLKTEQVLHNYSEDKRKIQQNERSEINQKNLISKQVATEKEKYFYYCDEPHIRCGFYQDTFYGWPEDQTFHRYTCHARRISDDLLLDKNTRSNKPIRDARCRLIVYDKNAERNGNKQILYEHAKYNWSKIKSWDCNANRICWNEKDAFPTSLDVEKYARQIGAYLDTGNKEV